MKYAEELIEQIKREDAEEEYNSRADVICEKLNKEAKQQ